MADEPRLDRRDPYLSVHAVNIFVRDQEQALRFYIDQLGFNLAFDTRLPSGRRWEAVAPPDGGTVLALVEAKPESTAYELIGRPTQVVFVTEDVIAKFIEWRKRGVKFQKAPRLRRLQYGRQAAATAADVSSAEPDHAPVWGGVYSRFTDIDGNSFTLVGFDELSREVEERRRAIAEKMEAERRAAQELEIATRVQARLFPQKRPPVQTLDYAGVCIQARDVGGDYYDFLDLGRGRLGLVIGDIAGKGIAAALLMANLQANLRSQCAVALDHPERFLESVNQLFFENTTDSAYATLFFGEYDDASGRLRYANCGHLSALLFRREGVLERLDSTSTVLGIFRRWECKVREGRLYPGDMLVLYTDGISEALNEREEEFGEQGLVEALLRQRELEPQCLVDSVIDTVRRFSGREQRDDITLIVGRCR